LTFIFADTFELINTDFRRQGSTIYLTRHILEAFQLVNTFFPAFMKKNRNAQTVTKQNDLALELRKATNFFAIPDFT